tara:strand:- start:930 stop:1655 length:726 start_codon:yes stop_codon:yes gene_type:complete
MSIKKIAICVVVNDSYWQTRYCIENLLGSTNFKTKLYILNNGTTDKRLINFCESLCFEEFGVHIVEETPISMPKAKNKLLKLVEEDYICILPPTLLVEKFWAEQLYCAYENSRSGGVLSIRSGKEKLLISPFLRKSQDEEDYLDNGWFQQNNCVEGLLFLSKNIISEVGYFDEEMDAKGVEDMDYTFRASALGYTNFYIAKQSIVKIPTENKILFPAISVESLRSLRESIENMSKTKIYKK